jgi:protein ImuB
MALHFPFLPTDRLRRLGLAPDDAPLGVYAKTGNAFTLTAVNESALAKGLHPGIALADAQAIFPGLMVREAESEKDARLLDRIAAWADRFTPFVAIDQPSGLFLDVTGCAHLFGGDEALLETVKTGPAAQGFSVEAAIAPAPGAAFALARHGGGVVDEENLKAALEFLPVEALRLNAASAALLKRLGLKTIGQVMTAPRAPFAARAGEHTMRRLDQALGRAREALIPRRPAPPVYAMRRLMEPVIAIEALMTVTEALCADLAAALEKRAAGARLLRLTFYGVDARARDIILGLSQPERSANTMLRLLKERIDKAAENFNAEFGFEAARLDAVEIAPIETPMNDLDAAPATRDPEAEARLIDMIAARLGAHAISKIAVRDTHAPEEASPPSPACGRGWREAPGEGASTRALSSVYAPSPTAPLPRRAGEGRREAALPPEDSVMRRPVTLFPHAQSIEVMASVPDGPPLRFRWRRMLRSIVRAEGPERIAPDWLKFPGAPARDYYRIEDDKARRYWVYREGLYGESGPPRWFIHGLFP